MESNNSNELKLDKVSRNLPDPIFAINTEGIFIDVNDALCKMSGYSREEIVGKSLLDVKFLPDLSKERALEQFVKRILGDNIEPYPLKVKNKKGDVFYVEINATPVKKNGKILGDIGVVRNITTRKENR